MSDTIASPQSKEWLRRSLDLCRLICAKVANDPLQAISRRPAHAFKTRTTVGMLIDRCRIDSCLPGGPADRSQQLDNGDTILEVNGERVDESSIARALVGDDVVGSIVQMRVQKRDGRVNTITLTRASSEAMANMRRLFELFAGMKGRSSQPPSLNASALSPDAANALNLPGHERSVLSVTNGHGGGRDVPALVDEAIAILTKMEQDRTQEEELVRWEVSEAMSRIGVYAAEAAEQLERVVGDSDGPDNVTAAREAGLELSPRKGGKRVESVGDVETMMGAEVRQVLEVLDADMVRHICHETELQQVIDLLQKDLVVSATREHRATDDLKAALKELARQKALADSLQNELAALRNGSNLAGPAPSLAPQPTTQDSTTAQAEERNAQLRQERQLLEEHVKALKEQAEALRQGAPRSPNVVHAEPVSVARASPSVGTPRESGADTPGSSLVGPDGESGIGVLLTEEQPYVVRSLTVGGPVQQTGALAVGDVLMAVDGARTADLEIEEVRRRMQGPEGSVIQLQVLTSRMGVPGAIKVKQIFPSHPDHLYGYGVKIRRGRWLGSRDKTTTSSPLPDKSLSLDL